MKDEKEEINRFLAERLFGECSEKPDAFQDLYCPKCGTKAIQHRRVADRINGDGMLQIIEKMKEHRGARLVIDWDDMVEVVFYGSASPARAVNKLAPLAVAMAARDFIQKTAKNS